MIVRRLPGALLVLALAASVAAAQPRITATIDPTEIGVGAGAELTVTITGVQSAPPLSIPPIDGLTVTNLGQSVNVELVNGRASTSVTQTFQVTAARAGRFTIPPVPVQIAGTTLRTRPLALVVRPGGAASAAGGPRAQDALMLELELPDRPIYVGQVVTAELRLLVRDGARVSSVNPPELDSSAFTVKLDQDQPRQTREQIGGVGYTTVRWPLALSAVSAGTHTLAANLTVVGSVPEPGRRPRGLFDDFFGRREQSYPLRSAPQDVSVVPLPAEGRPADFGGAIGEFRLTVTASPTTVTVGDPITTRIVVEGNGNFDRVSLPELTSMSGLKTYAPRTQLETTDSLGLVGTKTFEQAVVPERADLGVLPGRRLSYFDPELGRYETVTSAPIPLQIATAPAGPSAAKAVPEEEKPPAAESFELAPNRVALGRLAHDPRPLALTPWFLAVQAVPLLALGALWVLARRRERQRGDLGLQRRLAARRAVSEQMAAMERAVAAGDEAAFFTAARRAIQERVGAPPPRPATSLTLDELERALPDGAEVRGAVRDVFRTADAVAYSGAVGRTEDLARWRTQVAELLRRLEDAR